MSNNNSNRTIRPLFRLTASAGFIATLALASAALAQAQAGGQAQGAGNASVKPTEGGAADTFTVQFQDTDILQALQMLSMQGRRNIVASKGVSGAFTANLYDVTVMQALEVLMRANDLRMEESGNFIYIYTAEEWGALQLSRLKKESKNFSLEYLNAKDAAEFITPMLSAVGKVSFVGHPDRGFQPSATDGGSDSWAYQGMIVVSDYPENMKAITGLLKEIDTPPAQVAVESTVVSTDVNQQDGFGVDVSVIGKLDFNDLTSPLSGANELFAGQGSSSVPGYQPPSNEAGSANTNVAGWAKDSTLRVGVLANDVAVFLRMLDSVQDTTILARPRVMALNRQRAQILIGERVGYLSSTTTQTSTTQTVEFLDTGIKLIFRPFISTDGSIRMELAPSVSKATIRDETTEGGDAIPVPNEQVSEVVTNVRVKDGQTLVLGGLFKEETTISRRQVPGLGDVPILGNAFKGYDDELLRQEIIFLVTPTIVKDTIAKVWSDEAREFEAAARIGAREGLLPWSRDTLTTSHNQQALDALAAGDRDLALFHVEASLRLWSQQPEMIRLREDLTSGSTPSKTGYERSILQRMVRQQMSGGTKAPAKDAKSTDAPAKKSASADTDTGGLSANVGISVDGSAPAGTLAADGGWVALNAPATPAAKP